MEGLTGNVCLLSHHSDGRTSQGMWVAVILMESFTGNVRGIADHSLMESFHLTGNVRGLSDGHSDVSRESFHQNVRLLYH